MLKLTNFVTRPMTAAAAFALLAVFLLSASSHATSMFDASDTTLDQTSRIAFTVSSTDLIDAASPTLSSATSDYVGGGSFAEINNGTSGATAGLESSAHNPNADWTATFVLDTSLPSNALGYDISRIETFSGWGPAENNLWQDYEVLVSVVGSPSFTTLGSYSYEPDLTPPISNNLSTRMVLTHPGNIATGVDAIRFVLDIHTVWREIDVIGTATVIPEPSSVCLVAAGLLGMIGFGRRRK